MKLFDVLTRPSEVFAEAKSRSSLADALVTYAGVGFVSGFLLGAFFLLFLSILAPSVGYAALVIPTLLFTLVAVVGSLLLNGVYFLLAKLFGGKGSFSEQYYLSSLLVIPLLLLSIAVSFLSTFLFFIPFAGVLLSIGFMLYNAYLTVLYLKEAHGFGLLHAVLVVFVTIVVFAVLFVLLLSALFLSVLGSFFKGGFAFTN